MLRPGAGNNVSRIASQGPIRCPELNDVLRLDVGSVATLFLCECYRISSVCMPREHLALSHPHTSTNRPRTHCKTEILSNIIFYIHGIEAESYAWI